MSNANEALWKIDDYLSNLIDLDEFENWSADYSWNIHRSENRAFQDLAYLIRSILNEHCDDPNEASLRKELANILSHFNRPAEWSDDSPTTDFSLGRLGEPLPEFVLGTASPTLEKAVHA